MQTMFIYMLYLKSEQSKEAIGQSEEEGMLLLEMLPPQEKCTRAMVSIPDFDIGASGI